MAGSQAKIDAGGGIAVIRRALACVLLSIGLTVPALADDRADCRATGEPDTTIAACTRLIGLGGVQAHQLSDFHVARGNAYRAQADFDRAIADFDEAIRLDPALPFFLALRGNAWFSKRDYQRAIADYERALQLNPKLIPAYVGRASAH